MAFIHPCYENGSPGCTHASSRSLSICRTVGLVWVRRVRCRVSILPTEDSRLNLRSYKIVMISPPLCLSPRPQSLMLPRLELWCRRVSSHLSLAVDQLSITTDSLRTFFFS